MKIRIGQGIDIHAFAQGRRLVLGGVEIPHSQGLLGHSDADALLHAVTDAVLGAIGTTDIGSYFPDTDQQWKNADSRIFLEKAMELAEEQGFRIENVDVTLLIEAPKIKPHVSAMKTVLCEILKVEADACAIKATTSEKLGYIGRQEGVLASAVVLLIKD